MSYTDTQLRAHWSNCVLQPKQQHELHRHTAPSTLEQWHLYTKSVTPATQWVSSFLTAHQHKSTQTHSSENTGAMAFINPINNISYTAPSTLEQRHSSTQSTTSATQTHSSKHIGATAFIDPISNTRTTSSNCTSPTGSNYEMFWIRNDRILWVKCRTT